MAVIQTGRGVPYMRQIIVEGQTLDVKDGTTYLELAKNFQKKFDHDIVLVLENNKMRELFRKVKDGATVTFLTTGQIDGYNTYRRSATLLLLKAIYDVEGMEAVRGMKVEFSVSEGYYVSSKKMPVDQETLDRIEKRMKELVNENLPIEKHSIPVEEAIEHFAEHGMIDKARLFRFRRSSSGNAAGIGIPGTDLEAAGSTSAMDPFSGGTGSAGNCALVFILGCYIIGTGHL